MQLRRPSLIRIRRAAGQTSKGWLVAGPYQMPVALGRTGTRANKREGDGATPRGEFHPLRLWWRADRHPRPMTLLPVRPILPEDAWCEDPSSRLYNRSIKLGPDSAGDRLTRADHLYDFIVEIDHNVRPRVASRGSAVFIHLARPGYAPTAGCVALDLPNMRRLLAWLDPGTRIVIG